MHRPADPVPPGGTIGILGGGQLGRMLALAAARLGIRAHIYAPETDSPAFDVAAARTCAAYGDDAALADFAAAVDVATYEFENVPVETVRFLEARVPVRPGSKALETAQDRLKEKRLARDLGARTADFAAVTDRASLDAALAVIGAPAVLKTTRMGYDGKGQAKIRSAADADTAFAAMRGADAILEAFVPFAFEVSVVAARGADGDFAAFDVTHNEHRDHILHRSIAPAPLSAETAAEAVAVTKAIAEALDYVGVLGVEFFVVTEDGGEGLRVNEIAPRVHNSGHWTMGGAVTCQFEQHIRAACGWPLGATTRRARRVEMTNLIGDSAGDWRVLAGQPGIELHLYGKRDPRPGRKMGHFVRLADN